MSSRFALAIVALFALGPAVLAGVASPDPVELTQPDGTRFTAFLRGDEYQSWIETETGFSILKNRESGYWEFADRAEKGRLLSSGQKVGREMTPPPGILPRLRPARRPSFTPRPQTEVGKAGLWAPRPISGARNLLILLTDFSDRALSTTPDAWSQSVFDMGPAVKSVAAVYRDNSFGKLQLIPVAHSQPGSPPGIVKVSLARAHPDYGNGSDFDTTAQHYAAETEWINEALQQAASWVPFASFDSNQDGLVSRTELNIYFVTAGYDTSTSTNTPSLWAHAWSSQRLGDVAVAGKNIENWAMSGELNSSDVQHPMGVIAHELGHSMCRLPDLYDVGGVNSGMGVFSLMSSGSHARLASESHSGLTPAPMDAWSRYYLGWTLPRSPQNTTILSFPTALSAPDAAILLKDPTLSDDEYFLVENRYPEGWDLGIESSLTRALAELKEGGTAYTANPLTLSPTGTARGTAVFCGLGGEGAFPAEVVGNIALIQRGSISFQQKVLNAKAAGAIAAVIYNNAPGSFNGTLGTAGSYIPAVAISDTDGPLLQGKNVALKLDEVDWHGGLMVIHVDENAGPSINNSSTNMHQGVTVVEASDRAGSLLAENGSPGHVSHLFFRGNNDRLGMSTTPDTKLHDGRPTRLGIAAVSEPGPVMTALVNPAGLSYVVPWVVNNQQWSSRLAFFNGGDLPVTPHLRAVTAEGTLAERDLDPIAPMAVVAYESAQVFGEMTGYALYVDGPDTLYPSFLTFNLDAVSGRSPAQTTGMHLNGLSNRLIFGYLPSQSGGTAGLVLAAPGRQPGQVIPVQLQLFGADGAMIDTVEVNLAGSQPFARVLRDLFNLVPEDATVIAQAPPDVPISGTTFAFNAALEPAMSLPFQGSAPNRDLAHVLPWIVNNNEWSSRVALFNPSQSAAQIELTAVPRTGATVSKSIEVAPLSLFAAESDELFPELSGFSLMVNGDQPIYPSYLTFNLEAASGRSPAENTGASPSEFSSSLVFGYLPSDAGGLAAVVLMAPEAELGKITQVDLALHDGGGVVVATAEIQLEGRQPYAAVLGQIFSATIPADAAVTAISREEEPLTGVTFVFNQFGEPSMSAPFALRTR